MQNELSLKVFQITVPARTGQRQVFTQNMSS